MGEGYLDRYLVACSNEAYFDPLFHSPSHSLVLPSLLPLSFPSFPLCPPSGHGLRFLRRFKDAIACYQVVVKIDPSTAKELEQEIELLEKVQRYVANAREQGVSEESLVITLDALGVFACS